MKSAAAAEGVGDAEAFGFEGGEETGGDAEGEDDDDTDHHVARCNTWPPLT